MCRSLDLADSFVVRVAFATIVMWGAGTSGNRAQRYLPMALADRRCDETLRETATQCRKEDLAAAYRGFQLAGMGRSFFTKWLAFAGGGPGSRVVPLILDDQRRGSAWMSRHSRRPDVTGNMTFPVTSDPNPRVSSRAVFSCRHVGF